MYKRQALVRTVIRMPQKLVVSFSSALPSESHRSDANNSDIVSDETIVRQV